jgi:hypothetical protein
MRRILVMVTILLSLLIMMVFPEAALGLQAPTVWVDANGNVHSSPPESTPPAGSGQAAGTYSAPGYTPPASPGNTGSQAGTAIAPANRYLLWQDPKQGAFSVSLPMGWRISGGAVRTTQVEVHYVVRAQSPDGGAQLFMDDPKIMMREVPNQGTQMTGARVGQVMPTGSGTNLLLEPYRPGDQFAAEYVQQTLCPSATMMHGGPIAGQTDALNAEFGPIAQAEGKTMHADVGEVSFKCGARAGYVYAITVQAWQPGGAVSIWAVYRIAGYTASPADSAAAAAAVNQALGTFQMNQAWLQDYAKQCNDIAGNVIRESNAITETTIQREQAMNAAMEASLENSRKNAAAVSNAIAGSAPSALNGGGNGHDYNAQLETKNVCDDLGRCQTVDADVSNWWSDCSGTFYPGPDSGGPPPASLSACWAKGH